MSESPPSPGPVYTSPPNSSMAIVSLVAGILGLTFFPVIGSIVAVITAPMAKKEIRESGGALGGEGLAKAGQILGWIGIALSVLGLCIGGVILAIPFCAILLGLRQESILLPLMLSFI